jgi:hypothetical protein
MKLISERQLKNAARRVLLRDWDPLDIGENPALADEYDAYLACVVRLLAVRSSAAEVGGYLKDVETKLGVHVATGRRERTVRELLALRAS